MNPDNQIITREGWDLIENLRDAGRADGAHGL
jgi:hypothetical protein